MNKLLLTLLFGTLGFNLFAQFDVTITSNMVTSCNDSDIVLTATPTGGLAPYTYVWREQTWPAPPAIVGTSQVATGLGSGQYSVTAFDANNDSVTTYTYIQSMVQFYGYTSPAICPLSNGRIYLNIYGQGVPPYTIAYSNGVTHSGVTGTVDSLLGLASGLYQAIVTDANGCFTYNNGQTTSEDSGMVVGQSSNILANLTTTASNCADGTATAAPTGGTAPYTYIWSCNPPQYGATATGLPPYSMSYTQVTISDADGCSQTDYAIVQQGPNFVAATTNTTPSNCFDGTATVIGALGTAPYTYSWNTNPIQNTQTATGLSPFLNTQATVTDAQGCWVVAYAYVPAGPNYLQSTANSTPETCSNANGSATVSVSGGTSPYAYLWSNGNTTPSLQGMHSGYYTLTITDAAGCVLTVNKHIGQVSPVSAYVSAGAATCSDNDGTASVTISGGTPPYTTHWNTGATVTSIANLHSGYYSASVVDATGCTAYDYSVVQYPHYVCDVYISGHVYDDLNSDCSFGSNEYGTDYALLHVSPSVGYVSTDANGHYGFYAQPGTYTITPYPMAFRTLHCPGSGNIVVNAASAGTSYPGNDFYEDVDSLFFNLESSLSCGVARPGFYQTIYLAYRNSGTIVQNATLSFTHDAAVSFISCGLTGSYNLATNTYDAPLTLIPQSGSNWVAVTLYVPASLPIGTSLHNYVSISPTTGDVFVANNADSCQVYVTGSYDPNDKTVEPKGFGAEGYIFTTDSILKYTINFQNTGNDTAFTVVIKDTLDSDLDVTTFRLGAASHPVSYTIDGVGVVTFTFNNILLADSTHDEANSHGQVSYFIHQNENLPFNTQIENTAYIYFDFNTAIVTNTTLNTIFEPLGIKGISNNIGIVPNPATDATELSLVNGNITPSATVKLYSITGSELKSGFKAINANGKIRLTNQGLSDGIYFVKITDGNQSLGNGKVIFKR